MRRLVFVVLLVTAACSPQHGGIVPVLASEWAPNTPELQARRAQFQQVSRDVGAVARTECRRRSSRENCDFLIMVDTNPRAPVNAFQTLDDGGRPVIIFTQSRISATRNADDLAAVMGHEAAHHIQGHIRRQAENAAAGAEALGGLAELYGGSGAQIEAAQQLGADVGSRSYSRSFELEADELGTIITYKAGYNPLIGLEFFDQVPDPGNQFLATHPPNAQRIQKVRDTAARLVLS